MQEGCQDGPTRRSGCRLNDMSCGHSAKKIAYLFCLAVCDYARDIPAKDLCMSLQHVHMTYTGRLLIAAGQQLCRCIQRAASVRRWMICVWMPGASSAGGGCRTPQASRR